MAGRKIPIGNDIFIHLDLLKMLGKKGKNISSKMVMHDGDLSWYNPYKITKQTSPIVQVHGNYHDILKSPCSIGNTFHSW